MSALHESCAVESTAPSEPAQGSESRVLLGHEEHTDHEQRSKELASAVAILAGIGALAPLIVLVLAPLAMIAADHLTQLGVVVDLIYWIRGRQ